MCVQIAMCIRWGKNVTGEETKNALLGYVPYILLHNFSYSLTEIDACMSKCTDVCMTLIQYLCKMNPFHLFSLLNIALKATDCSATLVHHGYF